MWLVAAKSVTKREYLFKLNNNQSQLHLQCFMFTVATLAPLIMTDFGRLAVYNILPNFVQTYCEGILYLWYFFILQAQKMNKVFIIVHTCTCKYSEHWKPGKELTSLQSHDGEISFICTGDEHYLMPNFTIGESFFFHLKRFIHQILINCFRWEKILASDNSVFRSTNYAAKFVFGSVICQHKFY